MNLTWVSTEIGRIDLMNDLSTLEHQTTIRQIKRNVDYLLYKHNSESLRGSKPPYCFYHFLDNDGRETFGRFVQQEQPTDLPIRARAIASICCSPPESWLPRLSIRSLKEGKQIEQTIHRPFAGAHSRRKIFSNAEIGKDLPALWNMPRGRRDCAHKSAGCEEAAHQAGSHRSAISPGPQ